jgi:endonuclease YncB( thermonuclease family)
MYDYEIAEVLRVVDGDTLDARLSLGFGLTATLRFRLAAIDTPEIYGGRTARGADARAFTAAWLDEHGPALGVRTFKGAQSAVGIGDGAFGRWLGDVYVIDGGRRLVSDLVLAGFG